MNRSIRLGEVHAVPGQVRFVPTEPGAFVAREGDRISFALPFHTDETSRQRETWRIELALDLDGRRLDPVSVQIDDRPGFRDTVDGSVFAVAQPGGAGEHVGAYRVVIVHESGPWSGEPTSTERFEYEGSFRLHVG